MGIVWTEINFKTQKNHLIWFIYPLKSLKTLLKVCLIVIPHILAVACWLVFRKARLIVCVRLISVHIVQEHVHMYTCDIDIAGYPTHVIGCCPENSKKNFDYNFLEWRD